MALSLSVNIFARLGMVLNGLIALGGLVMCFLPIPGFCITGVAGLGTGILGMYVARKKWRENNSTLFAKGSDLNGDLELLAKCTANLNNDDITLNKTEKTNEESILTGKLSVAR